MITPPVSDEVIRSIRAAVMGPAPVELTALQRFVRADKTAVIAAILHVAILIVTAFSLHLSAKDVAILGTIVSVGVTYFLGLHFTVKAKVPK